MYKNIAESRLLREISKIKKKIQHLERQEEKDHTLITLRGRIDRHIKVYHDERQKLWNELHTVKQKLDNMQKRKLPHVSSSLRTWLSQYVLEADLKSDTVNIVWVSEGERYVIIKVRGCLKSNNAKPHPVYSYMATRHFLIDTFTITYKGPPGCTNDFYRGHKVGGCTGRLTEIKKQQLLDTLKFI